MAETAILSERFQISIPETIRSARHWRAGQTFALIEKGSGLLLVPVPRRDDLSGSAKGAQKGDSRDRSDRY